MCACGGGRGWGTPSVCADKHASVVGTWHMPSVPGGEGADGEGAGCRVQGGRLSLCLGFKCSPPKQLAHPVKLRAHPVKL